MAQAKDESESETPSSGVSSIIHLANVSAAFGSTLFPKAADGNANSSNIDHTTFMDHTKSLSPTLSSNDQAHHGGMSMESPSLSPGLGMMESTFHDKTKKRACPKQHQLPMFLSSKFLIVCGVTAELIMTV